MFKPIKLLTLASSLGIAAFMLMIVGLSGAAADGYVDFTLDMEAPTHVAADSRFTVRIPYYNLGTALAPDAWLTATLPPETQFITATDRWGNPLPPDWIDGKSMAWYFTNPPCKKPLDACCGHVVIILHSQPGLSEGDRLTTTASVATSIPEADLTNNDVSQVSIVSEMAGSFKQVHARHGMPGDVLTYTIRISIAQQFGGSNNGRWVSLTDTLPFSHQVRFLGWRGIVTGTQITGHLLRWQGQVQAGNPLTLQYRLGVEGIITPGAIITNMASLGWDNHHLLLEPAVTVITLPSNTMALGPFQGGQFYHQYGVSLTVPPGAVTDTTRFQFRPLFTDTRPIPPGGLLFAHRAFEMTALRFGEQVRQFNRPLTITMRYTDTDIAGLKRETIQMWTRSGPEGPWAVMSEPVRMMSGTLTFTTTHFTQFALFGEGRYQAYLPLILKP